MKRYSLFLLAFAFFAAFLGCKKSDSNSCPASSAPNIVAPASEIAAVQAYLSSNSISATQHSSGLFYQVIAAGTGNTPSQCSLISVNYTGRLTSGSTFDQSTSPLNIYLYELIAGWRIGLPLIKAGGSIKLYIPPSLGYGSQQAGSVPPNSILIFDISLISSN